MRSPLPPSPSINLGDDPDPASELGQRLAATAQTAQGLLTNYLFYGQRRQAETQHDERGQRGGDVAAEGQRERSRRADETHVPQDSAAQPTRYAQPPGSTRKAADRPTERAPRLHLRLVHSDDRHATPDPLARDALTETPMPDALNRDGLLDGAEQPPAGAPDLSTDPRERR